MLMRTGSVNLAGGWSTFWGAVEGSLGPVTTLLNVVGAILVVGALIGFAFEKRRSGGGGLFQGQGATKLTWALVIGIIFAAPGVILPVVLRIFDAVCNGLVNLLQVA